MIHHGQKPVAILRTFYERWGGKGGVVDLACGTRSFAVMALQMRVKGFMMDLDIARVKETRDACTRV